MKEKRCCFLSIFAVAILVVGCPRIGEFYHEGLGNGYAVCAADVIEQTSVVKMHKGSSSGTTVVFPTVFAYGWNEDFILAKQHPLNEMDWKVDASITNWYIVEVASGSVHGPLSEGEFNKLKTELKVPAEISLKTIQRIRRR
jgi:hypothetical protein